MTTSFAVRHHGPVGSVLNVVGALLRAVLIGTAFGALDAVLGILAAPHDLGVEVTILGIVLGVASLLINAGWAWAGLGIGVGRLVARSGTRPTWLWGAVAGTVALAAASVAYYLLKNVMLGQPPGSFGSLQFWSIAAVVLGPLLGAIGAWTRRPGIGGWLAGLVLPVGAVAQMVVLPPGRDALVGTGQVIVCVGAALLAVVVTARFLRQRSVAKVRA